MKPARHSRPFAIALFLLVCGAPSFGCGGQSPQKRAASPASSYESEAFGESDDGGGGDTRQARIARLFNEIGNARVQLDLPREPGGDDIEEAHGAPMPQSDDTQPAAVPRSRTCKDICRISEKICENAELICELADELGGDPWAIEKCDSGKASCNEARKRCNSCVDTE